jgi:hypothetical protein
MDQHIKFKVQQLIHVYSCLFLISNLKIIKCYDLNDLSLNVYEKLSSSMISSCLFTFTIIVDATKFFIRNTCDVKYCNFRKLQTTFHTNMSDQQNKKPIIAVDIDEVLTPFVKHLLEFYNARFPSSPILLENFHSYQFWEVWGGTAHDASSLVNEFFESQGIHYKHI